MGDESSNTIIPEMSDMFQFVHKNVGKKISLFSCQRRFCLNIIFLWEKEGKVLQEGEYTVVFWNFRCYVALTVVVVVVKKSESSKKLSGNFYFKASTKTQKTLLNKRLPCLPDFNSLKQLL